MIEDHKSETRRQHEVAVNAIENMWRDAVTLATGTNMLELLATASPRGSDAATRAAVVRALSDDLIASIISMAMFGTVCANERMYASMLQEPPK